MRIASIVKYAKRLDPLIMPKHIAHLLSDQAEFLPLTSYIYRVEPYPGEIGIYGGRRIIVSKEVKNGNL